VAGIKKALIKCTEHDIPVLIICPEMVSVWAIPKNFEKIVSSYKLLVENGFKENAVGDSSLSDFKLHKEIKNKNSMRPRLISESPLFLELRLDSITRFSVCDQIDVSSFTKAYRFKEPPELSLISNIVTNRYNPKILRSSTSIQYNDPSEKLLFTCESTDFIFQTFQKNRVTLHKFDDPLGDELAITINITDCFIFDGDVKKLTNYLVEHIPESSSYFVPKNCRLSSKLNELAILGQKLFENPIKNPPSNLTDNIKSHFNDDQKLAEAAAFFITPDPQGKMNEEYRSKVQFKHLIDAYKKFYIDEKLKKGISKQEVSKQEIKSFFLKTYNYSEEKSRGAVKLITPD